MVKPPEYLGNILIVEDSETTAELVRLKLGKIGFNVSCSYTFSEADSFLKNKKIDLMILDLNVHGEKGLNYLKKVRSDLPKEKLPVIVMTANSDEQMIVNCIDSGANDYLIKPFNPRTIAPRLKSLIDLKINFEELLISRDNLKKALNFKRKFLSNISHELKTPLNSVLGVCEIISDTNLSEEQKGYLKILKSSGDRAINLVDQLLDLVSIEFNSIKFSPIPFSLKEALAEVYDRNIQKFKERIIELTLSLDLEIPEYLKGDKKKIVDCISELVLNAYKFTEEGSVSISATLVERKKNSIYVKIAVADTGIGISQADKKVILSSFKQVSEGTTRNSGGFGSGLFIVNALVEEMKGSLNLSSSSSGTEFEIVLPLEICKKLPKATLSDTLNIALINSDPSHREIIKSYFVNSVETLLMFSNAEEAISVLSDHNNKVDFILCEYTLSGMNGIQFSYYIRKYRHLESVPISVFSSGPIENESKIPRYRLISYDAKPVKKSDVEGIILNLLARKNLLLSEIIWVGSQFEAMHRVFINCKIFQDDIDISYLINVIAISNAKLIVYSTKFEQFHSPKIKGLKEKYSDKVFISLPMDNLPSVYGPDEDQSKGEIFRLLENELDSNNSMKSTKKRILVVDDSEENRIIVKLMLRKLNIEVDEAKDGIEAIEKTGKFKYDCILMDIQMPKMDGWTATTKILDKHVNSKHNNNIIALSANSMPEDIQNSFSAGCKMHLAKPVRKNILVNAIYYGNEEGLL